MQAKVEFVTSPFMGYTVELLDGDILRHQKHFPNENPTSEQIQSSITETVDGYNAWLEERARIEAERAAKEAAFQAKIGELADQFSTPLEV